MTGSEDFLTASLHHANLQVDTSDPGPRPMIAVLDARPGGSNCRARVAHLGSTRVRLSAETHGDRGSAGL